MQEKHAAGDNIASWCTKCRLNLDHTIVAMDGELVVKVKCRTCGSTHKYRNSADAPKARTPRASSAGGAAVTRWEDAVAGAGGRSYPYAMDAKYRVGDCIVHERFGKGIVMKLYSHKCDVLFQDRERLMASGN